MKIKIRNFWYRLQASFWFLSALLAAAAILLSFTITAINVGAERTLEQDVEFAISQLVEIAVRALSPGINDPITAITCIDWLGAGLCQLANRKMPSLTDTTKTTDCGWSASRLRLREWWMRPLI